jgi:hypothetical protein
MHIIRGLHKPHINKKQRLKDVYQQIVKTHPHLLYYVYMPPMYISNKLNIINEQINKGDKNIDILTQSNILTTIENIHEENKYIYFDIYKSIFIKNKSDENKYLTNLFIELEKIYLHTIQNEQTLNILTNNQNYSRNMYNSSKPIQLYDGIYANFYCYTIKGQKCNKCDSSVHGSPIVFYNARNEFIVLTQKMFHNIIKHDYLSSKYIKISIIKMNKFFFNNNN